MDDGNGKLECTLAFPSSGGVDDMQVGCLCDGDHLVTVYLSIIGSFSPLFLSRGSRLMTSIMAFDFFFCSPHPQTKTVRGRYL
ncbi:hypothetical protein KFK09_024176 [Dendrobium nobile]|uniref:Uncharacterized protein n=1 Tax=Dendrobium nobile TaxID=94219 RepID=A0A8T3AIL2_DENNO|nr:hypothetical protein KFK09_024176 [Dendrobium nobile]